jgi:hypothetical protein
MGGRALTACEEDVGGQRLDVVVNDELCSRADLETVGGWTLVGIMVGQSESRADKEAQGGGRQDSIWLRGLGCERE